MREASTGLSMREVPVMINRDRRSEFLHFMRLPDGSPLATADVLDYLTINGFFHRSRFD